jgi:hypothetical protein
MNIPLAIFYYIYLIFVAIFLLYTLFNVYHLLRFGGLNVPTVVITTVYIVTTIAILFLAWEYTNQIDWQQSWQLGPILPPSL